MQKRLRILLASLSISSFAVAQNMDQQVHASGGAFYESPANDLNISVTVGQPIIYTAIGKRLAFTQGFQQPYTLPSATGVEQPSTVAGITVFPNPIQSELNLVLNHPQSGEFTVNIIDMAGRTVRVSSVLHHPGGPSAWMVNVADLAAGIYTLNVRESRLGVNQSIILSKQYHY